MAQGARTRSGLGSILRKKRGHVKAGKRIPARGPQDESARRSILFGPILTGHPLHVYDREEKEVIAVKRNKRGKASVDQKTEQIRKKRKEIVKVTKDRARNVRRATENMGDLCIVCGKRIKKGQPIRILPKDKKCQEARMYHLRTCGPGSSNWVAFKDSGRRIPQKPSGWIQLSFKWRESRKS